MALSPYTPPETSQLSSEEKLCSTCNAVIHKKAEICPKCGVRQRRPANKSVLLLLTFFLGGFGIHRFYLGNYFLGILYLLFFWTLIPGLIALVECIVFLFKSSDTIEENYTAHDSAMVLVVVFVLIIPFIGILAAVAIPAYHDYLKKSQVVAEITWLEQAKKEATSYINQEKEFPTTADLESRGALMSKENAMIESHPEELYLQATITSDNEEKTIRLTLDIQTGKWICSPGDPNGMEEKYLPKKCRSGR
jgi:TM2 domain-containing membrane protein YozV/Tfp pilus assembly major pilin PilA